MPALAPAAVKDKKCLELGCGVGGLPGLACSRIGKLLLASSHWLVHVTASPAMT